MAGVSELRVRGSGWGTCQVSSTKQHPDILSRRDTAKKLASFMPSDMATCVFVEDRAALFRVLHKCITQAPASIMSAPETDRRSVAFEAKSEWTKHSVRCPPTVPLWKVISTLFVNLVRTVHIRLTNSFRNTSQRGMVREDRTESFIDSDVASKSYWRCVSGALVTISGAFVMYLCRTQKRVALSSTEAECSHV